MKKCARNLVTRSLSSATGACLLFLAATSETRAASTEIRRETNGFWLFLDGVRTPPWPGMVYQPTEGARHIRSYSNSLAALYRALDEESEGGKGHGARLSRMGVRAIRIYDLPVENAVDAEQVKHVFRHLYVRHRIKVLAGDWAGLYSGGNFRDREFSAEMQTHLRKWIAIYGEEPWLLGWQLGNENNYHLGNGLLGSQIDLDPDAYYALMDRWAGVMKEELGARGLRQFIALGQGDLTEAEAQLIAAMKNIDVLGINCFRKDPQKVEALISLVTNRLARFPLYFAEIGSSADSPLAEERQADYIRQVGAVIYSHGAGRLRSGCIIGAFIHEATDQFWKKQERGAEADAHYGVLGKSSEVTLRTYLRQHNDFYTWVVPSNEAPNNLIDAGWRCLGLSGPYAQKYGRDYGNAMAYAQRAITLYGAQAELQQAALTRGAATETWALDAVGSGYFILGYRWWLQAQDLLGTAQMQGQGEDSTAFKKFLRRLELNEVDLSRTQPSDNPATNAAASLRYARDVFTELLNRYPQARLREVDGRQRRFVQAVQARFPELSTPYIRVRWLTGIAFVLSGLGLMLGVARLARRNLRLPVVKTESVMSRSWRAIFLLALVLYLASLFLLLAWWFHPVRLKFYTVQPVLYWLLTVIAAGGILFYFAVWLLMWTMRRPVWIEPPPGYRVAIVTTRVASEQSEAVEATLEKMDRVRYPHDSFLLDEENSIEAKFWCGRHRVIHFSRKGRPEYNQNEGPFQARTKGGNLNAWLYEHGRNYDFVTFIDPDHAPRSEFLDRVLGYFRDPNVAFVQAPHVFHNRGRNWIARGAAEQSYFFCGPIQAGLFGIGACVVNGSHSTFRVQDLLVMKENAYAVHDADDILTSVRLHACGKVGVYVPEILADGLVPETWVEFSKQQRRWAASMFNLLAYYFGQELRGVPWPAKAAYLMLSGFYCLALCFFMLLLIPFVSLFLDNPPVNADIVAFCSRYLPFAAAHTLILRFVGQPFLIQGSAQKGLWFRAGILWVASWWDFLRAFVQGVSSGRVKARVVASKWNPAAKGNLSSVLPHLLLVMFASGVALWTLSRREAFETALHQWIFLMLIVFSQGLVALRILFKAKTAPARQADNQQHMR